MKKTVIKGIAFVVIFVISLVVISMVANQGNGDMTAPMPAASLPTMAIVEDGQEINQMYGYTMQMDTADMRESITPIKTARQINAVVHGYGTEIAGVSYELRSIDGSRLIENTELTGTQEGDRSTFCFHPSERNGSLIEHIRGFSPSILTLKRISPLSLGCVGITAVRSIASPSHKQSNSKVIDFPFGTETAFILCPND